MRINCLSCGHKVELDDAYDDYEGQIRCFVCSAVLEIRSEDGMLKRVRTVSLPGAAHNEAFEKVR